MRKKDLIVYFIGIVSSIFLGVILAKMLIKNNNCDVSMVKCDNEKVSLNVVSAEELSKLKEVNVLLLKENETLKIRVNDLEKLLSTLKTKQEQNYEIKQNTIQTEGKSSTKDSSVVVNVNITHARGNGQPTKNNAIRPKQQKKPVVKKSSKVKTKKRRTVIEKKTSVVKKEEKPVEEQPNNKGQQNSEEKIPNIVQVFSVEKPERIVEKVEKKPQGNTKKTTTTVEKAEVNDNIDKVVYNTIVIDEDEEQD